jgi:hypothetical protein
MRSQEGLKGPGTATRRGLWSSGMVLRPWTMAFVLLSLPQASIAPDPKQRPVRDDLERVRAVLAMINVVPLCIMIPALRRGPFDREERVISFSFLPAGRVCGGRGAGEEPGGGAPRAEVGLPARAGQSRRRHRADKPDEMRVSHVH